MSAWPASLPQELLLDGFTESAEDGTIRSTVDVGPAKLRPRYTAEVKVYAGSLVLTEAQVATLETFYATTLVYGSDEFDWTHPRLLSAATLRFRGRPSYSAVGGGYWRTSLVLEQMP